MKKDFRLLICMLILVLLFSIVPSASFAWTIEGKILKVADGDTITFLDISQEQHRVRIAGIDFPEKDHPFSNASRKKLRELVAGKEVKSSSRSLTAMDAS